MTEEGTDHAGGAWSRRRFLAFAAILAALVVVATVAAIRLAGRHRPGLGVEALNPHHNRCGVTRILVPRCGHWFGVAPLRYTNVPLDTAMRDEERTAGRSLDIVHEYHTNWDLFPTPAERALALQPGHHRLLFINWKPATDLSWRQVANGAANKRIDRLARYIRHTFRHPFFLTIWHEPENDVVERPGSGHTAGDYRAMYRHVVLRLRHDGVTWAVTVMDYMGFDNWAKTNWFAKLWPGHKVVDWIGLDPYGSGATSGWAARNFKTLVNRPDGSFPGYYSWAREAHPRKPIMLAEWGVDASPHNPSGQAHFFHNVARTLHRFPDIKALVYFDTPRPPPGQPRTYLRATPSATAAYRALVCSRKLDGPKIPY